MILFVRNLTVIDFSYLSASRGLLGESYIVDVELEGALNDTSMVFDFAKVKKVIKQAIDRLVDHKLALPANHQALTVKNYADGQHIIFHSERGTIEVASPADAFVSIGTDRIDESSVTQYLEQQIKPLLPENISRLSFTLKPEAINGFYYHYSHGLKKHDGNCQRIAHGHRSAIQIYTDNMLSPRLIKYWSERWQDIYLGTREDLCEPSALQVISARAGDYSFRYQAAHGWFELSLPQQHCELTDCDTTVECLADYIVQQLEQLDSSKTYKVIAYEGVAKGAVAYSKQ